LEIFDTHAHLDMSEFENDLDEVVSRAGASGIKTIVTIGINPASNLKAIALAEKYEGIYAAVGVHPSDSTGITEADITALQKLTRHPRVVAIGELGLDFYHAEAAAEDQYKTLTWQLEAAVQTDKPIIIHCRNAQDALQPLLKQWVAGKPASRYPNGILHNFRDDLRTAQTYIEMGFYIAVGAYIGYPNSVALRQAVAQIPPQYLLIETDCPFLPPQKLRGRRNEPAYCVSTVEVLAQLQSLSVEAMAEITTRNARIVYRLADS
jgi:TatD DNase family protein